MWEMSPASLLACVAWTQTPSPASVPPLQIVDKSEHYSVAAQSIRGINAELNAFAASMAREEHGHTHSEIEVSSKLDPSPGQCRIVTAEVSLDVTTTLPEWQPGSYADGEVRKQWEHSLRQLQRHEAGHRDNAIDAAQALRTALLALPAQANCLKMRMAISMRLERVRWQLELRDDHYDRRTRFGLRDDPLLPSRELADAPRETRSHPSRVIHTLPVIER